jgi:hypothetical protein
VVAVTQQELEAIVRGLTILLAAYEPPIEPLDLEKVDNKSYTAGFRAGARSAYADAICRLRELRELRSELADVTRIGGDVA